MGASLKYLAEFFHGVATQLDAGISIHEVLEAQARGLRGGRFRSAVESWADTVAGGGTWSDGLKSSGSLLPPGTAPIIAAGERTGRLSSCCRMLAEDFEQRVRFSRTLLAMSWYPMLILVVALFVGGLMLFLNPFGNLNAQMQHKPGGVAAQQVANQHAGQLFLWIIGGSFAVAVGGAVAFRLLMPHYWYGLLPLNPRLAWRQSTMQFFRTWHLAAGSGLLPDQSLRLAGDSIQHPHYRGAVHRIAEQVAAQHIPPSQLLGPGGFLDKLEMTQIVTMEKTGAVDETLGRLSAAATERFGRSLKWWIGFLITLLVMSVLGFVIYQIIQFALGYVSMWDPKNFR